jgi:glutathione S-transferase
MAPPKLYTWQWSGNCYKARLLAALLGIELELVDVDYLASAHRSPEYLAVNPRGQIPALVDGDRSFTDSAAILVYLAGLQGPHVTKTPLPFWSSDVADQAAIVDWLIFAATWFPTGLANVRRIIKFEGGRTAENEASFVAALTKAQQSLKILEARLSANSWLVLDRPTVADIAVFVYVYLANDGKVSLDPYPAVKSWVSKIENLPGFISIDA